MSKIPTDSTPLQESDCFYMMDRYKDYFNSPLHRHADFELNFIENCQGAVRIVGESAEELGQADLAIIGSGVEHTWEQHNCQATHIREISIQFPSDLFGEKYLAKKTMEPIRVMLEKSRHGIAFPLSTIMKVYSKIMDLTVMDSGFYRMLKFLEILNDLAVSGNYYELDTLKSGNVRVSNDTARIAKVRAYVRENYRHEVRLGDVAALIGMTPTGFSRFFKMRTGRSITDYLIDMRLSYATRELVDTNKSISEICFECGFNNVSNFNRIFKKKKGSSPNAFRHLYQRRKAIV